MRPVLLGQNRCGHNDRVAIVNLVQGVIRLDSQRRVLLPSKLVYLSRVLDIVVGDIGFVKRHCADSCNDGYVRVTRHNRECVLVWMAGMLACGKVAE